jgi:hypothetical protein
MRQLVTSCAPHHPADFINGYVTSSRKYSHQDFQRPIAAPVWRLILREVLRRSKSTRKKVMRVGSWGHGGHGSWDSSSPSCHAIMSCHDIFQLRPNCVAHISNWGCPKISQDTTEGCVPLCVPQKSAQKSARPTLT